MANVIITSERNVWQQWLARCSMSDFYHTHSYHWTASEGKPHLLIVGDEQSFIAYPFLLRSIAHTPYCDITSVYGYGGPLCSVKDPGEVLINDFANALYDWMFTHKVVSAFSRLHPFLPFQQRILREIGEVVPVGNTVWISLSSSSFRQGYSRSLRTQVHRLGDGLEVYEAKEKADWVCFRAIYYENMDRLRASSEYYFPAEYFDLFRTQEELGARLLLARDREWGIVGGVLYTCCNGLGEYHLGAVRTGCLYLSPLKLLLDRACEVLQKEGAWALHLGGGYGGRSDTLLDFKSRFSPLRKVFCVWRCVVDPVVYDQLSDDHLRGVSSFDPRFFPAYRAKLQ